MNNVYQALERLAWHGSIAPITKNNPSDTRAFLFFPSFPAAFALLYALLGDRSPVVKVQHHWLQSVPKLKFYGLEDNPPRGETTPIESLSSPIPQHHPANAQT